MYILENEQQKISKNFMFFLAIMNFRVTLQPFSQNQKVNQSIKHIYFFQEKHTDFSKNKELQNWSKPKVKQALSYTEVQPNFAIAKFTKLEKIKLIH